MDGKFDTVPISNNEDWNHHVSFTSGSRWMVVYFCHEPDLKVEEEFRKLAVQFPSLTFAKVLISDLHQMPALADAGIPTSMSATRFEIVIGGRCLSSQPNAGGAVIQTEHLFDGKLQKIIETMVNQSYVVRKPALHVNPAQVDPSGAAAPAISANSTSAITKIA
jgi:hypothetical protein|uniref:Thioredoxin domain-containing protein n=1 Tax=Eutreptiella gymnastica TaxID=73025 RepID=A0A7S4FSN0_9EUGL|mmetsp:Transcript_29933/g.50735  ORF Transcript_29933/g.50735 Transcript_29933/m.50735 type:complete len:164 (+) Transcript_29933:26-517(+)